MRYVRIPAKAWKELLAYLRSEEQILRDSYGRPGKKREWLKEYRQMCPEAARRYERVHVAAKSAKEEPRDLVRIRRGTGLLKKGC